jgi:hypothetical protein
MKSFQIILFFAMAIVTSGHDVAEEHDIAEINWNAGSYMLYCIVVTCKTYSSSTNSHPAAVISDATIENERAPTEHVRRNHVRKAKAEKKKPKKPKTESEPTLSVQPKPITLSEALLRPEEIELSRKNNGSN